MTTLDAGRGVTTLDAAELARLRDAALAIAREAGALAMTGWRSRKVVSKKGAVDLVTEFDLKSEALIRVRLDGVLPGAHVVAEEGKGDPDAPFVWWVDPIDGTTNYAHGHPFFNVSIGLAERGVPVASAVVAPALGLAYAAALGLGATRNGERCTVSETATLDEALVATGFAYDRRTNPDSNFAEFVALKLATQGLRRCGAAALDLCFVADGTYDAYWEKKLSGWDCCAGVLLVEEAGGRTTGYDGAPVKLSDGKVVASNGRVHTELLAALRQAREKAGLP